MELINKLLLEKKTKKEALPKEIQEEINELTKTIKNFNRAVDLVEEDDDETNKELDEKEVEIANHEKQIVKLIQGHFENLNKKQEERAPERAPERREQERFVRPPHRPEMMGNGGKTETPKKKDNSVGWLIFAGVVFAATLGAVNMMKKRG
jgi:hypothetical protein